jgi:hypothetical protein
MGRLTALRIDLEAATELLCQVEGHNFFIALMYD